MIYLKSLYTRKMHAKNSFLNYLIYESIFFYWKQSFRILLFGIFFYLLAEIRFIRHRNQINIALIFIVIFNFKYINSTKIDINSHFIAYHKV